MLQARDDKDNILDNFQKTGFADVLRLAEFSGGLNSKFVGWVVENFEASDAQIRMTNNQALRLPPEDVQEARKEERNKLRRQQLGGINSFPFSGY